MKRLRLPRDLPLRVFWTMLWATGGAGGAGVAGAFKCWGSF